LVKNIAFDPFSSAARLRHPEPAQVQLLPDDPLTSRRSVRRCNIG
jgi:hypothetical protein